MCGDINPLNDSNKENVFCSDRCRDDFHNAKRKAERAINSIVDKIATIEAIAESNPHLALEIRSMIRFSKLRDKLQIEKN